jgi:hypothetical protein
MADQLFCAKQLDWDAPVAEVLTLRYARQNLSGHVQRADCPVLHLSDGQVI